MIVSRDQVLDKIFTKKDTHIFITIDTLYCKAFIKLLYISDTTSMPDVIMVGT